MADANSQIRIDIDASGALSQLKRLQAEISLFHQNMARGSAANAATSASMQKDLINNINATRKFAASMTTVQSTASSFTKALESNKLSMREYFRYAGASTKTFGRLFKSEFDTIEKVARERVKTIQTQYIKMGRDANGAIKAIKIRPMALDLENYATKAQMAAQKQQLFNQLMKQGSTSLLNFGKNTQWAGRQLMVGFTVPLAYLGTAAAKTFMQMEEQVIRFKRVYGEMFTTEEETNKMVKDLQGLAKEFTKYGVAVKDTMALAADAAAMGKMGADLTAQVANATRLAVLGGVEQAAALETTISVTNAFGVAAEDLSGKIDFLNAVENQTVTSIEDLTTAIPKAGPVIQQLGGNVEDLAFFLTAMKEGGINASEGANALKSGLASMINPTAKASEFLQGLGINLQGIVEQNKGDIKGTVIAFAQSLDKLDPLNRARAIEQLFGKFQFARLSTLFQNVIGQGTQAQRVLELTSATQEELAVLSERELKRIESSPMYKFKKAFEDLKASLVPVGEAFLKAVTPIIEFAKGFLDKFNEMGDGAKNFAIIATTVVAGIGPILLMTFGLVANAVANIIKMFAGLGRIFGGTGKNTRDLGLQTDYMSQQQLEAAAAAASLDQTHSKLIQTFTSEATAVSQLAAAYERAVLAQSKLRGTPAGGAKGKVGKYSTGIISVPGSGNRDTVPAMLTPGEAVIPKGVAEQNRGLIASLISGKIQGFNDGGYVFDPKDKKVETHLQAPSPLTPDKSGNFNASLVSKLFAARPAFNDMPQSSRGYVTALGQLTADLPAKLNENLKRSSGVAIGEFNKAWDGTSNKLAKAATAGLKDLGMKFDPKNPVQQKMLRQVENDIRTNVNALAAKNGGIVNDAIVSKATSKSLAKLAPTNDIARGLVSRANSLREYRTSYSKAQLASGVNAGALRIEGASGGSGKIVDAKSGVTVGRLRTAGGMSKQEQMKRFNSLSGAERAAFVNQMGLRQESKFVRGGNQTNTVAKAQAEGTAAAKAYNKGVAAGAPMDMYDAATKKVRNSPHPKAKINGKEDAQAYNSGAAGTVAKPGSKIAPPVIPGAVLPGAPLTTEVKSSKFTGAMKRAFVFAAEKAATPLAKSFAKAQGNILVDSKGRTVYDPSAPGGVISKTDKSGRAYYLDSQSGKRISAEEAKNRTATPEKQPGRLKAGMGKVAAGAGAASMVAMGLSMVGGPVGQAAGQAMMPLMAASMLLPMIASPVGAVVAGLAAAVGGFMLLKGHLDAVGESARKSARTLGVGSEAMDKYAELAGRVSSTDIMDKRRAAANNPFNTVTGKNPFGVSVLQSDFGKTLLAESKKAIAGGRDFGNILFRQLSAAVSGGSLSVTQARSVAYAITEELGNQAVGMDINAQLTALFGVNGENLLENPLEIQIKQIDTTNQGVAEDFTALQDAMDITSAEYERNIAKFGKDATDVFGGWAYPLNILDGILTAGIYPAIKGIKALMGETSDVTENVWGPIGAITSLIGGAVVGAEDQVSSMNAYVVNMSNAIENYQSSVDSIDVLYTKQIEAAKAAGDMAKASRLQQEYDEARLGVMKKYSDAMDEVVKAYNSLDEGAQGTLLTAAQDRLIEKYKDDPDSKNIYQAAIDAMKAKEISGANQYQLNMLLNADAMTLSTFSWISTNLTEDQVTKVLNLKTVLSGKDLGTMTGLLSRFSKTGQGNFIAKFSTPGMDTNKARDILGVFTEINNLAEVLGGDAGQRLMDFYVDPKNEKQMSGLLGFLTELKAFDGKDLTVSYIQNIEGGDQFAKIIKGNQKYFDSLDKNQKIVYTQVIATLAMADPITLGNDALAWAAANPDKSSLGGKLGPYTTAQRDTATAEYLNAMAEQKTKIMKMMGLLGDGDGTQNPSGAKAADPYEDILKRLRNVRNAIIKVNGGLAELQKFVGKDGKKNISVFKGLNQQLIGAGYGEDFVSYISSLDEATRKKFVTIKNGVISVTNAGKAMARGLTEAKIGEFQQSLVQGIQNANMQATAFDKLTRAGLNSADAMDMVSDASLAYALATAASDAEVDKIIEDFKNKKKLEIKLQLKTPEGLEGYASEVFGKIQSYFSAQEAKINAKFQIDTKDLQNKITAAEREIADKQVVLDDYNYGISLIEKQEEVINKKYDDRLSALSKVYEANQDIVEQQKSQLDIAEALSGGDLAAAAKAIQDRRAREAEANKKRQEEAIEASRKKELAGVTATFGVWDVNQGKVIQKTLTRAEIEKQIKTLNEDIAKIEEERLEPNRQLLTLAERQRDDQISNLSYLGQSRDAWIEIETKIRAAALASADYAKSIREGLANIPGVTVNTDANGNVSVVVDEDKVTAGVTAPTGDNGTGDSDNNSQTPAKPTTNPGTGKMWQYDSNAKKWVAVADPNYKKPTSTDTTKKVNPKWTAQKKTVDSLETQLSTLKSQASATTKSITSLQNQIKGLAGVAGMTSVVSSLKNQLSGKQYQAAELQKSIGLVNTSLTKAKSTLNGIPQYLSLGGSVRSKYLSIGGQALGSDIVPAMLTPGEFVISRPAVRDFGVDKLKAINSGSYAGDSVYNYEVSVNVESGANADEIARAVMSQIKNIDNQRIRGNRF